MNTPSASRDERIEAIFHEALDRPLGEREAFVRVSAGNDEAIGDEVMSLLAAHGRAGGFLNQDAIKESLNAGTTLLDPMLGRTLGSYRITDRIGSGGMGSVYLAERADDAYEQRVAIKLINRHASSGDILRRFHNERQVLANLNHPNIARLLDGGTTEGSDRQPYLVMEYVEGTRLDDYADSRGLTIAQRLDLFQTVCEAVQAAHRNLVVHRDLKPSNILVTDDGTVKLLDFGIAKVLDESRDGAVHSAMRFDITATIERRMTPAYASPEQVRGDPITTATDVYSLGVVLYELLTGHRPHRIDGATLEQASRAICEEPAPRPSTAVLQPIEGTRAIDPSTGDSAGTLTPEQNAARRGTDPARLQRTLRGDLENIVLMALRKEPERRYATVEQFAEDLRRYRQHHPVIARPDTTAYRAARFVRRNLMGVSVATAGFLVLCVTVVLIALALSRAIDAERLAESRLIEAELAQAEEAAQREAAERQRRIAEAINRFLIDDLLMAVSPEESHPADVTITEVIDRAASVIDERFAGLPAVEAEVRATLGDAYRILGQYDRATPLLLSAIALMTDELGATHPSTIKARNTHAFMQYEAGHLDEAEQSLRAAFALSREHFGADAIDTLSSQSALCSILMELERFDEAGETCLDMLSTARAAYGDDHAITSLALNYAGRLYMEREQLDEAEAVYRSLLESRRRTDGPDAVRTNSALNNLAVLYIRMERFADAEPLLREALAQYQRSFGAAHIRTLSVQGNLGRSIFEQGRYEEAEPILREAVVELLNQLGETHWVPGAFMGIHGATLAALERFEDAEVSLLRSHAIVKSALGPEHDRTVRIGERITGLYTRWREATSDEEVAAKSAAWRAALVGSGDANAGN